MRLVYFSPVPWTSFAQRPHKFVEWFHRRFGGSVLWVEPYPGRLPTFEDIRRSSQQSLEVSGPARRWLRVIPVQAVPIEPLPGINRINLLVWRNLVRQIIDFIAEKQTMLVIGKPSRLALQVVEQSPGVSTLYDAMDDFPMFYTGLSEWAMRRTEKALLEKVDCIWCSSTQLYTRFSGNDAPVEFVPNALDVDMLPAPRSVVRERIKHVFGYVGTIGSWFDWQWVIMLAKHFSNDEIRLIGPLHQSISTTLPDNIVIRPACNQDAAIKEMESFDVGLIPFVSNQLTASVDPVKYYEYRGLGLPVVTTSFGEMENRDDEKGVYVSHSDSDIVNTIEKALVFTDSVADIEAFRSENNWCWRFESALKNSLLYMEG